jgi:hypothetical protein
MCRKPSPAVPQPVPRGTKHPSRSTACPDLPAQCRGLLEKGPIVGPVPLLVACRRSLIQAKPLLSAIVRNIGRGHDLPA